ncbi:MAG: sodium:solute symporter family protein [Myxococcota bacterium]
MSASASVVVAVAIAYLALSLGVGLWPSRRASASAEGYVAGDRSLGLLVMYFITGATIFSSFAFLGAPGFAYAKGTAVFYILGYGALGFVPFYFLGPRAASLGRAHGFVTQADLVATRLEHPALAGVMALVSVVAFVPYLALQIRGAGLVLEVLTEGAVPVWLGGLVTYLVVLVYVWKSGVLGVGWTNTFQGVFMLVLAWGLGLYLPERLYGGVGLMFARLAVERPEHLAPPGIGWTWGEYLAAVVVSAVGFSVWPHLFMKAFSARSDRTLQRTVVLYPTFQLFLVPLTLIGFAGVLFPVAPAQADQILPHMLMELRLSPVLVGLFCAGALAASMSSGDAMAHAAASIAVRDGWGRALGRRLSATRERRAIRTGVIVVMALGYGTALVAHYYDVSLVVLLLAAYGAVVQFAPAVVLALYRPRDVHGRPFGTAALAGMLAGALTTVGLVVFPEAQPVTLHPGLWGLFVNLLVLGAWVIRRRGYRDSGSAEGRHSLA